MGITNLTPKAFMDFRGGRVTALAETRFSPEYAIELTNCIQTGDGRTRRRPGYKQVASVGTFASITNSVFLGSVATVTAANTFFVGQKIIIRGSTAGSGELNGTWTVSAANSSQFQFVFTGTTFSSTADTGTVQGITAVFRMFDFQRQIDQHQLLVTQFGTNLAIVNTPGVNQLYVSQGGFSSFPWFINHNGTATNPTVTDNNVVAPDGTRTGSTIAYVAPTGSGANAEVYQNIISNYSPGQTVQFSCYLKVASGTGVINLFVEDVIDSVQTACNLTTTWQRFVLPLTLTAPDDHMFAGTQINTGNPSVNVQIWGAQFEYGTELKPYEAVGAATLLPGTSTRTPTILSSSESVDNPFFFCTNAFGLFATNVQHAYSVYNVSGTETLGTWGLPAPVSAPTVGLSGTGSGSLTLLNGRQYVFCYVAKWTDGSGNSHVHVGSPSPLSAGTGPCINDIVTVGSITASTNARVTHKWIFATQDLGTNQSSAFLFAAEITNATTSWADQLTDGQEDITRVAPFSTNAPPPAGRFCFEYADRKIICAVPANPNFVFCTGLDEISIGIPEECAPIDVQFEVPGGIKNTTAGISYNNGAMIATPDFWFRITGNTAATFSKQDNLLSPGCVGAKAVTIAQNLMIWLGPDKRIWSWDGATNPIDLSFKIGTPMPGSSSMNDISQAQLQNAEIKVYSFGLYHVIMVGVSRTNSPIYDWIQYWDASSIMSSSGYRTLLSDGSQVGLAEADMFTNDQMQAMANVEGANSTQYMYLADAVGNIYRWPDGFTDNGVNIQASWAPGWTDCGLPGVIKQNFWIDVTTDRQDAQSANVFNVQAVSNDGVNMLTSLVPCPIIPSPSQYQTGTDGTTFRASLTQNQASAVGKWVRPRFVWPDDNLDASISGFTFYVKPITLGS